MSKTAFFILIHNSLPTYNTYSADNVAISPLLAESVKQVQTTAYGTITYSYGEENRLLKTCRVSGDGVEYRYDRNGNVLSQTGSLTQSVYEYNYQNRMVRSRVIDDEAKTIASACYGYDPLGRRSVIQNNNNTTLRTLYDGLSFDVVKEMPVYASGGFSDTYNTGEQRPGELCGLVGVAG
ncbi:MAG: hypothetical protein SO390_05130 [Candidatus Treponema excrementipullorum]|nr:hypothetical protein [Candidatus Treponema excrementipullorum]